MRNLTICFFVIGLTFAAVDGAWAAEEKEYEGRTGTDNEKYLSALEEAKQRGEAAPEGGADGTTDGTVMLDERLGFVNAQGLQGGGDQAK